MQYQSYLSTYACKNYNMSAFIENEKMKKNEITIEFKRILDSLSLKLKYIKNEKREFLIIFSEIGLEDDIGYSTVSIVPEDFYGFDKADEEDLQSKLTYLDKIIENSSLELKDEYSKMKLSDPKHYIYFNNSEDI